MKSYLLLGLLFISFLGKGIAQTVGSTDGVFNVSDLGAANYSIPIKVPDGINGLQPNISISYNSQGGTGPIGIGWSVTGLSAITRTGSNVYDDSKVDGVNLSIDDRFALDGNRLIYVIQNPFTPNPPAYGTPNSTYRTETETFRDIKAIGTLGNGPASFEVYDQSGLKYEYGNTADSRQVPVGKTEAVIWYLNKVTDLLGNYMTYEYSNINGEVLPTYIRYNCNQNTGLTYQTYVYFSYQTGNNPNTVYMAGGSISTTKRINKISVIQKVGTSWHYYRSYTPEYTDDFYTHLTKVTEKGAEEAEVLPPTQFTYGGQTENQFTANSLLQSNEEFKDFASGDFNADGLTDIVRYTTKGANGIFKLFLNTSTPGGSPTFSEVQTGTLQSAPNINYNFNTLNEQARLNSFDFNGDGKDDFLYMQMQNYNPCRCSSTKQAFHIYLSQGNSLALLNRPIVSTASSSNDGFANLLPLTGDFDGDGKSEILLVNTFYNPPYNYINYLIGEKYLTSATGSASGSYPNAPVYVAKQMVLPFVAYNEPSSNNPGLDQYAKAQLFAIDYNGDGKQEVLVINKDANDNSYAKVYSLNVTFDANNNPVIGTPAFIEISSSGFPSVWHNVLIGDFNGDRITDVYAYHSQVNWRIGYGNGKGYFDEKAGPTLIGGPYYLSDDVQRGIVIADYNGDGKDDIYDSYRDYQNGNLFSSRVYFSKGNNVFSDEAAYVNSVSDFFVGQYARDYWLGDFNGDGQADFITRSDYYTNTPYANQFHPNENKHLLSQIQNGFGASTKISYLPLSNSAVYSYGNSAYTYPFIKRIVPFKVVRWVNNDNGVNSAGDTTVYSYTGLRFHALGKGLLGFEKVGFLNLATSMGQEKSFALNMAYAFPYLQYLNKTYNNSIIGSTTNTYGVYSYGNDTKRIFPYQISSFRWDALTAEWVTTNNTYSFYDPIPFGDQGNPGSNYSGMPFSTTVNKGNGLEISTQTFSYPWRLPSNAAASSGEPYAGQSYVNSKPYKVQTTNTRQGEPSYSRTAIFTYDHVTGLLNTTVSDPNTTNTVTTAFNYEYYGNPTDKVKSGPGVPTEDIRMGYDNSHRYMVLSYNAAFPDIRSAATYDQLTGDKLTATDPDGFKTTYTYDGFGRVTTASNNNGQSTNTTYNWGYSLPGDYISYFNASYYTSVSGNTGSVVNTLYDRLGREMKTKTKNFMGQWTSTRKTYNTKGQLASVSKPYFDLDNPQYITYTYDDVGRPYQTIAPEGTTTIDYQILGGIITTTTNPAGQTQKVKVDLSGAKVSVTDADNNEITYNYHSNGNVKDVSSGGNTLQTYTYDEFNNLKERWDPNYGIYKYTYDAFGHTLSQTDPKNQVYNYKYDALGRLIQKSGPEGDYDYTFSNSVGLNCGKLIKESGPNGANIATSYGMGDQILSITHNDNGIMANTCGDPNFSNLSSHTYSYDSYGRLNFETYPTNVSVQYDYAGNGNLKSIRNFNTGTIYYRETVENAMGRAIEYMQAGLNAPAFITKKVYDNYNLLTELITQNQSNGNNIRDFGYAFNPATGNLESRSDNLRGFNEYFSYDNLNRLTNTNDGALSNIDVGYSVNGNIELKTDAGNFAYDQANRLSEITDDHNIPHATQQVTYTPFDKIEQIEENNMYNSFAYWPNGERLGMAAWDWDAGLSTYKIYGPDFEREQSDLFGNRSFTYIRGPEGDVVGIVEIDNYDDQNPVEYFVLTDHLGSFTHIFDKQGNIVEEKSFDAWGRLRNPQTWKPYASNITAGQPQQLFDRGYTEHEHLAPFGIINMNGRLYDPVMGRMFSPDVNIIGSGNLQGYNRYTYAMNNPLIYTDPDGNYALIDDIVACVIGGGVNLVSNWNHISSFGQGVSYFCVGALSGEATLYGGPLAGGAVLGLGNNVVGQYYANGGFNNFNVGSAIYSTAFSSVTSAVGAGFGGAISPYISGLTSRIASPIVQKTIENVAGSTLTGFAIGGGSSMLSGNSPADAFQDGLNGAAMGFATGFITGPIEGLKVAQKMNRNPWTGKPNDPGPAPLEMASLRMMPVEAQALTLAKMINKSSFTIGDLGDGMKMQYDLAPRASSKSTPHKGVPTPHVQMSRLNINPETGVQYYNKVSNFVIPMTPSHIEYLYKYFNQSGYFKK